MAQQLPSIAQLGLPDIAMSRPSANPKWLRVDNLPPLLEPRSSPGWYQPRDKKPPTSPTFEPEEPPEWAQEDNTNRELPPRPERRASFERPIFLPQPPKRTPPEASRGDNSRLHIPPLREPSILLELYFDNNGQPNIPLLEPRAHTTLELQQQRRRDPFPLSL